MNWISLRKSCRVVRVNTGHWSVGMPSLATGSSEEVEVELWQKARCVAPSWTTTSYGGIVARARRCWNNENPKMTGSVCAPRHTHW